MRSIFLTGATGTIGSALVPQLLADPQTSLVLLVRAADEAALQERLRQLRAYWQWPDGAEPATRLFALRGDITLPDFGLSEAAYARVAAETSHIIHCAASVNLNMPLDRARATAVTPTRTVLALGRRAQSLGVLRKIDLVSTVGVWGRTPGHMPETPLPDVTDFHNTYEAAKAEAERVIWADGAKGADGADAEGLPLTVHRPSMVVGDSRDGRVIHFQVFYHLCEFLSGARTFGVMPPLGSTRLDTVPVDWVARAIDWSSHSEQTAPRILHLCSGPEGAIELSHLQRRVRQLWQARSRDVPTLRPVPQRLLTALVPVIGAVAGAKARRALRALPPVLEYLAEDQAFSNAESAGMFKAAGLPVPTVESYLDTVLNFYLDASGRTRGAAPRR